MKRSLVYIILFTVLVLNLSGQEVRTVGNTAGANYFSLANAFDDINTGSLDPGGGDIILQIIASTNEPGTATLYPSGYSGYTEFASVTIYPTGSGYTIGGNINGPLVELNGVTNVIFDGRVNQSGSANLIISNSSTGSSASTIKLVNSANANTVTYCRIRGASSNLNGGVIFFADAESGNGNDNNTFEYDSISSNASGRPVNALFSSGGGVSGSDNSDNIINSNFFFNFLKHSTASNGINLSSNTSTWIIADNSFYEKASFTPTADVEYSAIRIDNSSGNGFIVTGNFVGGRLPQCGGSAWTKTNAADNTFTAIYINAGTTTASSLQNNTIRNFSWSNSAASPWRGIHIAGGTVNAGNTTGNTIGNTSTGSITVTGGADGINVYGIHITGTGTVICQNNRVSSITVSNADANTGNFYGIYKQNGGATTISYNTVGDASTSNSINATSLANGTTGQVVYGIFNAGSATSIVISNNTVANLRNGTNNTSTSLRGLINGIRSTSGTNTISNNSIHHLSIGNANNDLVANVSVAGILLIGTTPRTLSGNTIYELSNTYDTFTGGVTGIFFVGSTSVTNNISGNFIHSLKITGANSLTGSLQGIRIASGLSIYSNNIITLGGTSVTTIYGIYDAASSGSNSIYFNTVYIGGSMGSGVTLLSYAIYNGSAGSTRNYRNNILVNARSTTGSTNRHFALYFVATGGSITCDYNDYYVSGTGGTLGYYGGYKTTKEIVTGQDVNSLNTNPSFSGTGIVATDYQIGTDLAGAAGTGITTDYGLNARGSTPSMGAWERTINKWLGTLSTDWATTGNWSAGVVPGTDASIIFDNSPVNDLYLDANRSVTNITNGQATYKVVTNGFRLTVKGSLIFTNNAKIDASSSGSTVEFAGNTAQAIPSGAFVNNQVYNLTVNNSSNITFSGTLNILSNLTTTTGALNAYTNSPTLVLGGSSAQTIEANRLLSNRVANLTIDNSAGVTLNVNLTIDNVLSVTSSKVFTLGSSRQLTLNGSLSMTGGGQIDASATGTTLIFSGGSAQSIPSGAFVNNRVTNLTINNANNLTLNGTLDLRGTFTTTAGRLDASTNSPTLILGGTTARGLDAVQFVNGTIHNLTIDNTAGVTLNSNLTVNNNLTINSSRIFTVSAGRVLTVTGTLTNNAGVAGFIIKSDVQGNDAKLLNNSTGVNATVEMAFTGGSTGLGRVFHYFVPPVASMSFDNSSIYNTGFDLGLGFFDGDLVNYSEVAAGSTRDNGWQFFDGWFSTTPFNTLVSSRGYNIHTDNNDRITFKGTLNGAAHSFGPLSFTNLGWNLVGNPYPCNYDLGGISHLTGTGDGVDNTVYFNRDGGYATWNVELQAGTSGYSNIMPPMQGFFVHATTTGQTLSLPTSSKTSSAAAPLRSKGGSALKKIKLVLNNGAVPDETIVCMPDKATDGFDSDYDAYKFTSSGATIPALYSEMSSVKYALNAIEPPATGTKTIPLTVILKADGTYKIDVTEFDNLSGYTVKLKHGTAETILKSGSSYTFTAIAGTYKDFQLVIGVGTVDIEPVTTAFFTTWYSDSYLYIKCPEDLTFNNSSVAIFDIQGKVVYRNDDVYLEPGQTLQLPVALKEGIYITVIGNKVKKYTSKVVII